MSYLKAKEAYAAIGVDTDAVIESLKKVSISMHCWQGDDVNGFDSKETLSGGIQTTGNYPGKARNQQELFDDIRRAFKIMPGTKRLNVHACYAVLGADKGVIVRDQYTYKHFEPWVNLAKELGLEGVDFNPTFFAHPMMKDGLSLSSPDEEVRKF
jgi:L-rhamnose isomerase